MAGKGLKLWSAAQVWREIAAGKSLKLWNEARVWRE